MTVMLMRRREVWRGIGADDRQREIDVCRKTEQGTRKSENKNLCSLTSFVTLCNEASFGRNVFPSC